MHFVIDGNNVAFHKRTKKPELNSLLVLIQRLQQIGSVFPVISSELKYRIDDPQTLRTYISQQKILESPPHTDSDRFILELTKQLDAFLVSNDLYKQYKSLYPTVISRRLPFMLVKIHTGEIMTILPWIHQITEIAGISNVDLSTKNGECTIEGSS